MVGIIAPQFAGRLKKDELPPELRYDYDPDKAKALLAEAGHPERPDDPVLHQPARGLRARSC